ncbi:FAD-dependent monooxygenase [Amycolatopsis silviterrae]|uniref:FAD-dependent monooxygenase n=1 Tax=Amycolatopsis silviterrae TaxID=1656914 RepID=A0ABW5HN96_9PSEU
MIALVPDPDGRAVALTAGEQIRAGYVVGADRVHSHVREQAGIAFHADVRLCFARAPPNGFGLPAPRKATKSAYPPQQSGTASPRSRASREHRCAFPTLMCRLPARPDS